MLRPLDVLVVLKLAALHQQREGGFAGDVVREAALSYQWAEDRPPISFANLGLALGVSASQAFAACKHAAASGLLRDDYSVRGKALLDVLFAIKYYMPAQVGGPVRGVPTSFAAEPLGGGILYEMGLGPVWAHAEGSRQGLKVEPLYKTAPGAALNDVCLYEYLALVDALRIGRAREVERARSELSSRLVGRP